MANFKAAISLLAVTLSALLCTACNNADDTANSKSPEVTEVTTTTTTEATTTTIATTTTAEATTTTATTTAPPTWEAYPSDRGVRSPSGRWYKMDSAPSVICHKDELALIYSGHQLFRADDSNGMLLPVSLENQLVLDYTVAHDSVYWFTLDQDVWCCDWLDSTEAYLFYEDAVGVSPFQDEGEGAIVRPGEENLSYCWEAYGLPLYSPYGEGYTRDSATTTTTTTTVVATGD